MSNRARISVESTDMPATTKLVSEFIGGASSEGLPTTVLGVTISVVDSAEVATYAKTFLEREGLEESNPIWKEFDSTSFPIDVNVTGDWQSSLVAVAADALAQHLSVALGKKVAVVLDDDLAFVVYDSGKVVRTYSDLCDGYFQHRRWKPAPGT